MANGEVELQRTIDALNERTAAYDVQIVGLNETIAGMQQQIDQANENATQRIAAAESAATLRINQAEAAASAQIQQAREAEQRAKRLYASMRDYVAALEADAGPQAFAAINAHRAAADDETLAAIQSRRKK